MVSNEFLLFVDTETSGKPKNWQTKDEDKWPYIVQIAWVIFSKTGEKIKERNFYIEASDYQISADATKIHGISEEMVNEAGVKRKEALRLLYQDLKQYKPLIIGHFIELDIRMLEMGFKRAGKKNILKEFRTFCTMLATSEYIHLPNRHYPMLSEIYQMLFKRKLENAHDAMADVNATAEVYFELVKKGEVNDDVIVRQNNKKSSAKKRKGCGLTSVFFTTLILFVLTILWNM